MTGKNKDSEQGMVDDNTLTHKEETEKATYSEPVARKRGKKCLSLVLCIIAGIGMLVYSFYYKESTAYTELKDITENTLKAIKNGTLVVYVEEKEDTYPVLFDVGVGLLSYILATLVNRVIQVVEEFPHFRSCYKKNIRKIYSSCSCGISLGGVILLLVLGCAFVAVGRILSGKEPVHIEDLITFTCAIGVYPLVAHLLGLNALSEAEFSKIVEEEQLYPAYTLAWNYYFEVLQNLLPIVNEKFTEDLQKKPRRDNEDAETDKRPTECKEYINSKKLILIVPHNCRTHQNLEEIDSNFQKLRDVKGKSNLKKGRDVDDVEDKGYSVPLYNVIHGNKQYKLLLLYVSQPLKTLYKMSGAERVKCLTENNLEEQVELFCNTLQEEILSKPLNEDLKEKCIVLPIKADYERSLGNGGLVESIVKCLKHDEDPSGRKHPQPFFVPPPPPQKFSSPAKPKAKKTSPLKQDEYYQETSTNNEKELLVRSKSEKNSKHTLQRKYKKRKKLEQQKNVATKEDTITPKNEVGNNSENHSLNEEHADEKHKQTENVESRSSTGKSLTFSTEAQVHCPKQPQAIEFNNVAYEEDEGRVLIQAQYKTTHEDEKEQHNNIDNRQKANIKNNESNENENSKKYPLYRRLSEVEK
ncbi:uncharacterized protein LOC124453196 [Xenia sp. Carnegie-2017]|uniref:uncharacterized protein LOC124453196 n=1 Tax=Xenia sp. Carnegie-2017 TaxID=2897299 RepID=UPI001F04D27D|nr:uncharacterized protein LOC124453196 [Xenia sp. Carnegie-2017]